jgi:hypothetical protein
VNEDIKCYATEDYAYEESEVQESNFSHLQEHFEALVTYGYENDCGGFGDVILNVKTRELTVRAQTIALKTTRPRDTRCRHGAPDAPDEVRRKQLQKIRRQG